MKTLNKSNKLSAARRANLAAVRTAAFTSGTSRNAVLAATLAACGRSPIMSLYAAARQELQIGFMAAALARKGDNREPTVLMDHSRERLDSFQGFGGKGKLRTGMKGRRTKQEEEAYASARVLVSGVFRDAGVKVPETRGGDTSQTRKGAAARKGAKVTAKAANDSKPVIRRFAGKPALLEHFGVQAAALLANVNRNAAIAPIELKSAVQDFAARIKAIAA